MNDARGFQMAMTGWELHEKVGGLLLNDQTKEIDDFIASYGPLAAFSAEHRTFAVLRRFHPSLNCAPDHPTYPSDDYSMRIGYYTGTMETFYHLPKSLTYVSLQLVAPTAFPFQAPDFLIETAEYGITCTNSYELMTKLAPDYKPLGDDAMRAAFAAFTNERPVPVKRIPITSTHITLDAIGDLAQSEFDDWWTVSAFVPLAGQDLPITVMNFNPQDSAHADRVAMFDSAIRAFMALGVVERQAAGTLAIANCHDFIEAVGEEDWNREMAQCHDAEVIWKFIKPRNAYVSFGKKTGHAYVALACNCEWEEEHGLQFVYRNGRELIRVSAADGWVGE